MARKIDGIGELRRLVNIANCTREDAFDGLTIEQTIKLLQACRSLDLEVLPDQLNPEERAFAARTGKVSKACKRRLYRAEGLPETGIDWENH